MPLPGTLPREAAAGGSEEEDEEVELEDMVVEAESSTGVGAAWSSKRWSEEVLLLELMELGRPLKLIHGWVESCMCGCGWWWWW